MLPNFICPGVQKAATTTLYNILKQHPDIYLPRCKEVHFFDKDESYAKGRAGYEAFFSECNLDRRIVGDFTPSYIYLDFIPQRILDMLGSDVKFVIMLRNPVDRAFSQYCMTRQNGHEKYSFEQALKLEASRLTGDVQQRRRFSYVDRGFYTQQVERYFQIFPRENFHFILFESFIRDIGGSMVGLYEFLQLNAPTDINYDIWSNRRKKQNWFARPDKLLDETRSELKELFLPEIHRLESLIRIDLSDWL